MYSFFWWRFVRLLKHASCQGFNCERHKYSFKKTGWLLDTFLFLNVCVYHQKNLLRESQTFHCVRYIKRVLFISFNYKKCKYSVEQSFSCIISKKILSDGLHTFSCLKNSTDYFYFLVFPQGRNLYSFFLFWGDGRVPYNAGNTTGFSNVAQQHFRVGCPS